MRQHITIPTRKSKTSIDHAISTIPDRVNHHDVLNNEEINDHDTPYLIFNIKKEKYQPRYRFIRSEKSLVMENYVTDFQQLPLNLIYSFDDPDDQVAILNKLIIDCIDIHVPLKRPIAYKTDSSMDALPKDLNKKLTTYSWQKFSGLS